MADILKKVILVRLETSSEGTFGYLIFPPHFCFTLERPVCSNRPNIDAIPTGSYLCNWTYSPRFKKNMYLVEEVKDRSGIRIHPANLTSQLNGCIALGEKLGTLNGKKAVLLSQPAVRKLETFMKGKSFILELY